MISNNGGRVTFVTEGFERKQITYRGQLGLRPIQSLPLVLFQFRTIVQCQSLRGPGPFRYQSHRRLLHCPSRLAPKRLRLERAKLQRVLLGYHFASREP